jgi:tetratricopeptide (TPR) repeat protein
VSAGAAAAAKFVVTALVKPWDAIEKIGHDGIDRLSGWVQGEPKQRYERLAREIEQKLAQLPSDEIGTPEKLEAALSMTGVLFAEDGLTIDELIRQRLNRDEAIKEQRRRFDRCPESGDEPEASICRQHVIPAIFDVLFADPASLEEIDLAFKQAVLEHLDDIRRLPEESAAALRRLAAQALVLKPYRRFDPDRLAPSALLEAAYAMVPFEGREDLLDDAIDWCADERDLGIRLYVGPGGMGKTRFAIQLCDQVCSRMPEQGWRSGFLARGFAGVPDWLLPNLRDGREPLLIVVDYAETRPGDLIKLLALAHDLPSGRKLRLLLLARSEGDWWSDLPATTVSDSDGIGDDARAKARAVLPGPAVERPIGLGPLAPEADERRGVFERALAAFHAVRARSDAPAPMPDLSGDDFRSVLMIHLSALAAVEGRTIANARDLMEATLQRERGAWQRGLVAPSLKAVSATDVQQAMTLITLAGGAPNRSAAIEIMARAPRLRTASRALLDDLGNVLSGLYPNPLRANGQRDRPIEPLRPDLLGEELVDRALSDDPGLLTAGLEGVSREQAHSGLTVLTRLARRRPEAARWLEQAFAADLEVLAEPAIHVAIETGHPMGKVLGEALKKQPLEDPSRLEPLIPKQTTELLDVGVVVMAQQWDRVQAIPKPWADDVKAKAARIANNLASRLSKVGQRQAALAPAQEAADLFRALTTKAPDAFGPLLAKALNNLAAFMSEVGQCKEALAPAQEAADLYRALAAKAPDAYRPGLASALNNLANRLGAVGQREAALAPAQEAADLYRELAAKAPDAHRPELAMVLNTLASRLSEGGQCQAALAPAEEAVAIRRELAAKAPDAYRPDLASALNNLANRLSAVGQRDEALAPVQEAADLYRELAAKAPDAWRPDLASALSNLANCRSEVGQRQEALATAKEAVAIRRELAATAPDAYRPDLAGALNNLANRLSEVGQREAALQAAEEAVRTLAPQFLTLPAAFASWMATMVRNYLKRCQEAETEPDMELLAPLLVVLQRMQEGE